MSRAQLIRELVADAQSAAGAVWGGLPSLPISTKQPALMPSKYAAGWFSRRVQDKGLHRLRHPGTSTADPAWHACLRDLIAELDTRLPTRAPVGHALPGCSSRAFERLGHLAGYPMKNGQQPPLNAAHLRTLKELDGRLTASWLARAASQLLLILDVIESRNGLTRRGLSVDTDTSAALPNGGAGDRKVVAVTAVLASQAAHSAIAHRDVTARGKLGLPRCYVKGSRANQVDSFKDGVSKPRPVTRPSDDRALLKGTLKASGFAPADKSLDIGDDLFRCRVRLVFAYPAGENVLLSVLSDPLRVAMKAAFPMQRLDTIPQMVAMDKRARAAGLPEVLAADTTNFDGFYPLELLALICSTMERRYGWGRLAWDVLTSPILATNDQLGDSGARIIGDPFSMDRLDNALTSGLGCNSLFGTLGQMLNIVMALRDIGAIPDTDAAGVRVGDCDPASPVWAGYQSDDVVYYTTAKVRAQLEAAPLPSAIPTALETPAKFKGMVRNTNAEGETWTMDSFSWLANFLMKENDAFDRPHMAAGLQAALSVYGTAPDMDKQRAIFDAVLRAHYGVDLTAAVGADRVSIEATTYEDRMFLLNKEYIHYKIDPALISPALLAGSTHTIPPSMCDAVARMWGATHKPRTSLNG